MAVNTAVFGAYILMASVFGFFLWQTLFATQEYSYSEPTSKPAHAEEQRSEEQSPGTNPSPNVSKTSNDEAIAEYTKWLAIFTLFLVLATLALFVSGERNVEVARRSAKAANDSVDIAKQALIAGQRAFISVSYRTSANKNIKDGKITGYTFTPVWFNAGNTPTRNMENHANLHLFDREIADDWDFPNLWHANTPIEKRRPVPLGVTPKNSIDGHSLGVDIQTVRDVIDGRKFLYIWGSATYNDVFPNTERHVTRYAVQVIAGGNPEEPEKMSFRFELLSKQNCSDEECKYQGVPADWKPRILEVK